MWALTIPMKLLLSLLIGAAIGLERETYEHFKHPEYLSGNKDRKGALGVRTFSLITTLGTMAGLLRPDFPDLFLTVNIVFLVLLIAYYITGTILIKDNGITTEMAIIFSYLIGIFIALDIFPIQLVLAITVVLVLIMSQKETVRQWIAGIKQPEMASLISYAIIALVILPFLPNIGFALNDIPGLKTIFDSYQLSSRQMLNVELFNPYKLWFIVALITGVDLAGYLLSKTLGQKKGWLLTSFVGGFVSSTSTTISLAQRSKKHAAVNKLVAAAIFANLASFLQLFVLIASTNSLLLIRSTRLIFLIILSSGLAGVYFLTRDKKDGENMTETKASLQKTEIFSLRAALKFILIYLTVGVVAKIALVSFGETGFYLTSMLAALTGIDAVVLNLTALVGNTLTYQAGVVTIILVNAVNLLSKAVYSYLQGKREFALKFGAAMVLICVISLLALI